MKRLLYISECLDHCQCNIFHQAFDHTWQDPTNASRSCWSNCVNCQHNEIKNTTYVYKSAMRREPLYEEKTIRHGLFDHETSDLSLSNQVEQDLPRYKLTDANEQNSCMEIASTFDGSGAVRHEDAVIETGSLYPNDALAWADMMELEVTQKWSHFDMAYDTLQCSNSKTTGTLDCSANNSWLDQIAGLQDGFEMAYAEAMHYITQGVAFQTIARTTITMIGKDMSSTLDGGLQAWRVLKAMNLTPTNTSPQELGRWAAALEHIYESMMRRDLECI